MVYHKRGPSIVGPVIAFLFGIAVFFAGPALAQTGSKALSFRLPSDGLWRESPRNSYTVGGSQETFAWSNETVEGDLVLSMDIVSNAKEGEGVVIVYGNGVGFSKGCLIFNLAHDFQSIRAHTIYTDGFEWVGSNTARMNFQSHRYTMRMEIRGDKATLFANGELRASGTLPPGINRRGRIALYKYPTRPPVTFSAISLRQERLPDDVVTAPEPGGKRIALLIGNGAYEGVPLRNPPHDAEDLGKLLRTLGFSVTVRTDANQREMETAINAFCTQIKNGDVALFYYSGHGSQVSGENYLVPVGENLQSETDIRYKAVNAGLVLGKMEESGNRTNIIILDACRNNPFSGVRAIRRGLTMMDAPAGSFIAYATAPNSVALDGSGRNGIYTKHLLEAMRMKGVPVEQMFKVVLRAVEKDTNGQQVPWTSSSLRQDFFFNP